nr:MAG TPA: hypothetical protein [Bacteriophage sp.]
MVQVSASQKQTFFRNGLNLRNPHFKPFVTVMILLSKSSLIEKKLSKKSPIEKFWK